MGEIQDGVALGPERVRSGDRVLVSGTLGDHGMAVMIARGGLALEVDLESDTAPVHELAASLLRLGPRCPLDARPDPGWAGHGPQRAHPPGAGCRAAQGGCAAAPAHVAGACEILGIDPLYVASEGRFVAVVAADKAEAALAGLRALPLGADAADVGEICADPPGLVLLDTAFGGSRIVDVLVGDPLPRIC